MSSKALAASQAELSALAEQHSCAAVSFSGGKDSLAVIDLALRHFKKVHAFCMYFVPGLQFDAERMEYAKSRFGVEVRMYPHTNFLKAVRTATFCDVMPELVLLKEIRQDDIDRSVMADVGATLVLTGEKKSDGIFRRRKIANMKSTRPYLVYPIKEWLRWEVLSYLKSRNIDLPRQAQADNAGVSLATREILYLHDFYPHDYEVVRSFFPYVETVVLRREWFGLIDG